MVSISDDRPDGWTVVTGWFDDAEQVVDLVERGSFTSDEDAVGAASDLLPLYAGVAIWRTRNGETWVDYALTDDFQLARTEYGLWRERFPDGQPDPNGGVFEG